MDSPIGFFTNVAARLLSSELNLNLNRLQIYPTNQYTPAANRLLQVSANLYDCTTNRTFASGSSAPYCPSLFRPIFRQTYDGTNWALWITGYREVLDTSMANPATAPMMISVQEAVANTNLIPVVGVPPNLSDRLEPMIRGVPVVVAARKGFPNFNEFSMQTYISLSRLLEFRRDLLNGPVTATNQMYTLNLTNTFGLEAWNSYSNAYPRNLQLLASVDVIATVTNLTDTGEGYTILSNRVSQGITTNIVAGSWAGWPSLSQVASSFLLPFGSTNNFVFANASYEDGAPFLVPISHTFALTGLFSVPRFWLNLNVRLLYILIDTDAQRIVDYVNLDDLEPTLDITGTLAEGADCSGSLATLNNPANQWCTNRVNGSSAPSTPTIGVLNQIADGLGLGSATPSAFLLDPYTGLDVESAIDGFRYNLMGWSPIFPKDQGNVFYRSNVFYVPLDPYSPLYLHTSLQANDPLVHYIAGDLSVRAANATNVTFYSFNPPLPNLGQINDRYEPWGGNPFNGFRSGIPPFQIAAKDALVYRPDAWSFPTNQTLGFNWVGQVHRGTPWQTVFLKSTNVLQQTGSPTRDLITWQQWTGNMLFRPDWSGGGGLVADALSTAPTNDWELVSRLAPLFNTNDVRLLSSVNQFTPEAWSSLLDGLTAITNPAPAELDAVVIYSNSPLAQAVARGLETARSMVPKHLFTGLGDILATPELSVTSPWLTNAAGGVDDGSLEIIPSQLIALLRPDSFLAITPPNSGSQLDLSFSGFDDYAYTVERSSNLLNWTSLGTYSPTNGVFKLPTGNDPRSQFYRTVLAPW